MPRRPYAPAQPSLFDARPMQSAETRRPPAPEQSPLFDARPSLSADDKLALHTLFHYGRAHVFERERALPSDAAPLRRAIEAGYVIESRHQFHLTPTGVEMIAREDARTREESRREEEAMGAAMRRHATKESGRGAAPPAAPAPRAAAGVPTDLNLWVLSEFFGGASSVSNRLQATDVPHLRRCLKAGLIVATKERLTLTDAGAAALAKFRASQPGSPKPNRREARAPHRAVTAADAHALFKRQREAFAALFPAVSRARLHIVRRPCPYALTPCAGRDLAWMVDGDVHLLARALQRGPNVVGALLAHELGHAADASRHLPGSEQRADDLAAVVLGKPIRYTAADAVQTFGPGAWPRPLHLHR